MIPIVEKIIISGLCLLALQSQAQATTLTLSEDSVYARSMTRFQLLNAPLVREQGYQLVLEVDLESPAYFGGASLEGNQFRITLGNELPQQNRMTPGALAFAMCHELGHLLGGAPKKLESDGRQRWASAEGQADYYAAKTCLPALLRGQDASAEISQQVLQAGLDMMSMIFDLIQFSKIPAPDLAKADRSVAPDLILGYPSLQCRLDTVRHAAAGLPQPECWMPARFHQ